MRVFNIDITRKGISPVVQVTEFDAMSRFFTLVLRNGSSDYEPPENPNYSVWYKTKDSTGWYDTITLPDESTRPAVVADGNVLTVEIAEAATTSCGELAVMITGDDGYQLTVTGIMTRSADIPGYNSEEVENYYNVYITRMQENAARAENAADIAVAYGAAVEVDEEAQQLNITHHSDTEGGVGWLFGSAVTSSAEGSVAAFPDGADDVAVKSLVAEITPVQSGSGDPSPTNVRAISGRTGLTVTREGKNIAKPIATTTTLAGVSWAVTADGKVTASGTATGNTQVNFNLVNNVLQFPKNVPLIISGSTDKLAVRLCYRTTDAPSTTVTLATSYDGADATGTIPDNAKDSWVRVLDMEGTGVAVNAECYPMVRLSGNADYEPYTATEYPISWQTQAGAIYGGTLNVTTGVLTVDRAIVEMDGSTDETWVALSAPNIFRHNALVPAALVARRTDAITNETNVVTYSYDVMKSNYPSISFDTNGRLFLAIGYSYTTVAQCREWLAANPLQVCYYIATPTTYQLSPTEVKTLLGGNTIYTDAGAVSVEYVADTKLYIDNKVAELQALILEN